MKKFSSSVASNIWKLYVFNTLRWAFIIVPIIVLFYQDHGLSMKEIFIIQSVASIIILGMEIPSGYFSDRIGRKLALLVGSITYLMGFGLYCISFDFWGFIWAEIFLALGISFFSGTDSAILYDTLLELKKEEKYKHFAGRMIMAGSFGEAIASICGGFLAVVSLRTPFYAQVLVALFIVFVVLALREPTLHKPQNGKKMLEIFKYALFEHAEIRWLTITHAILMTSGITMFWFTQPYFKAVGLPLVIFGLVFAALRFGTGAFSYFADPIEQKLGKKFSLILLLVLPAIGYFLLGFYQTLWAIGFFFIFQFVRGFAEPVLQDYVNRLVHSDIRATVLSVSSFTGRLFFAFFGPFMGWINDLYSLQTALLMGGGIFAILGMISLFFLHRNRVL